MESQGPLSISFLLLFGRDCVDGASSGKLSPLGRGRVYARRVSTRSPGMYSEATGRSAHWKRQNV